MGRPPLDLTTIGTNTTNAEIPHLESTPVGTKTTDPNTESSSSESYLSYDRKISKYKIKRRDKIKKFQKRTKLDSSDSLSSDSGLSDESDYKINKFKKKKSYQRKDPIKFCAKLTSKLMTPAYKSKIIKLKLNEDPLHNKICFLTFIESIEMTFSQYKGTCEIVLDDPK